MIAPRFHASIWIPAVRGNFQIAKQTDSQDEAMKWLAGQVARHPDSESYSVWDCEAGQVVHQSPQAELI